MLEVVKVVKESIGEADEMGAGVAVGVVEERRLVTLFAQAAAAMAVAMMMAKAVALVVARREDGVPALNV